MIKAKDVDSYIAACPAAVQKKLQQLRQTIKKAAPEAEELISYQIPAYKFHGMLVFFAAWANHISVYPAPWNAEELKKEMSAYEGSKGTIKFPLDKPLPLRLIAKMVKFRMKQNLEKANAKAIARKNSSKNTRAANFIKYHNDGSIWAKGTMKNGLADGYWEWFRKDGIILRSGFFSQGKQTGEWTTYDKAGKLYKVTRMK
jgi:uncharacterized protein YdhG (YjbR/CyaY superfamily)